ncbi:hypothetical protein [Roseomonas indoligenes]|uniref:Uncharacterized protein n=1 Tax=Roseomonas indoligenes TaxID=2820811 RepID=A0A940S5P2_9PROT|nr:hypothetical protein [Pararoseomonas indoligenes]MBP0491217.1 hypothetical protein [Pararoseomonas indoligenes]
MMPVRTILAVGAAGLLLSACVPPPGYYAPVYSQPYPPQAPAGGYALPPPVPPGATGPSSYDSPPQYRGYGAAPAYRPGEEPYGARPDGGPGYAGPPQGGPAGWGDGYGRDRAPQYQQPYQPPYQQQDQPRDQFQYQQPYQPQYQQQYQPQDPARYQPQDETSYGRPLRNRLDDPEPGTSFDGRRDAPPQSYDSSPGLGQPTWR